MLVRVHDWQFQKCMAIQTIIRNQLGKYCWYDQIWISIILSYICTITPVWKSLIYIRNIIYIVNICILYYIILSNFLKYLNVFWKLRWNNDTRSRRLNIVYMDFGLMLIVHKCIIYTYILTVVWVRNHHNY